MLNERPERVMMLWLPELDETWLVEGTSDNQRSDSEVKDRERLWAHTLQAIERLIPGNEPLRNGWCAMRARGPARYYGGETEAALALINRLKELGFAEARVGVANGRFAAEQAAYETEQTAGKIGQAIGTTTGDSGVRIIAPEDTERLLGPLPIARATGEDLAEMLLSLGIRTLGAFAALPEPAVRERFGAAGVTAHRRARGLGTVHTAEVRPHPPLVDLAVYFALEPPLDGTDQLAFACTPHAETLLHRLITTGLVCTELRVELIDDIGVRHERQWAHPGRFSAADVINRVRWQAGSMPRDPDRGGSGIAGVCLTPVRTARAADHEPGLWSTAPDERIHHHLSRVQSLLGHRGVGTGELVGGRLSADRQRLVPWGTRVQNAASVVDDASRGRNSQVRPRAGSVRARDRAVRPGVGPWPGHLPRPSPNIVFAQPPEATLLDGNDAAIALVSNMTPAPGADLVPSAELALSTDLVLSADPVRLNIEGSQLPANVRAWSSPWPLRERWWVGDVARYRMQVLLNDGDAWLLRYELGRGWFAEARYD